MLCLLNYNTWHWNCIIFRPYLLLELARFCVELEFPDLAQDCVDHMKTCVVKVSIWGLQKESRRKDVWNWCEKIFAKIRVLLRSYVYIFDFSDFVLFRNHTFDSVSILNIFVALPGIWSIMPVKMVDLIDFLINWLQDPSFYLELEFLQCELMVRSLGEKQESFNKSVVDVSISVISTDLTIDRNIKHMLDL